MVPVVNSVLIAITIIVLTYFLLNIKNELNSFENIYNKEQDYKHSKLQKTFGDIDNNEQQLKGKTDEHNEILTTHTNLLKNSEKGDAIVDGNPDIAENDVYSLITHNNKLIDDNYSAVFNILEKNESDDATMLKGPNVSGGNKKTKIKMDADGNVKINVTNPDKLQVCDINGDNCSHLITRRFIEQLPVLIPDNIENFEEESVVRKKKKLILNEFGELCEQDLDGKINKQSCKEIGLLRELQGPPGTPSVPVKHIYEMKGDGYCMGGYIQPPSNDLYHNNGLTKNQCFSKCSQDNKCEYMAYSNLNKICALYDSTAGDCSNRQKNDDWAINHKTYKKIDLT